MDINTVAGFVGAFVVLVGFVMNQIGIWKVSDFEYDFINLIGGGLMSYYAYQIAAWPFLVVNGVWALFSLKDCIVDVCKRRK